MLIEVFCPNLAEVHFPPTRDTAAIGSEHFHASKLCTRSQQLPIFNYNPGNYFYCLAGNACRLFFIGMKMTITIYHNPKCGTSRNTLAMIRNSGVEPEIIEYLKHPPSREKILELVAAMGLTVRDILRQRGTPYDELHLGEAHWTDAQLLDFIQEHPILMNRPIVITPLGTKLCRPSEVVLDILPSPQQKEFSKEDGEKVVDAHGRRVKK